MNSRRWMASAVLAAGMLAGMGRLGAQDVNSLRAVRQGGTDVDLQWTDATPTRYCLERDGSLPVSSIVGRTDLLSYLDTPPASGISYYAVEEEGTGFCTASFCSPAAALACGDPPVAGNNAAPGSTDLLDAYAGCALANATGSEYVYTFTVSADYDVTAALSGLTADLDLVLIQDKGNGCDPNDCILSGDNNLAFAAAPGVTYYVVVDGMNGAASDYVLTLTCSTPQILCQAAGTIACGSPPVSGNNGAAGSTQVVDDYPGCSFTGATGPEYAYRITPSQDTELVADLAGMTADLDLFLVEERGRGCDPADCIASGDAGIDLLVTAGTTYYLVVDGIAGAVSDYTFTIDCPIPSSYCQPAGTLLCSVADFGRNDDPGSDTAIDQYPTCTGLDETGPDFAYEFVATGDGTVTVDLTSTSPLDVFVLSDPLGAGLCDPDNCIAYGDATAIFSAAAGERYFVLVDGRNGAAGPYAIDAACGFPPGDCSAARSIGCGERHFASNADPGSTDVNDRYACTGLDESGPEYTYMFSAPSPTVDTRVTAYLELFTGDVDIFVLENLGTGCDPQNCVAWGDDTVTFDALAGHQYFLVVDGRSGAVSEFRLRVECSTVPGFCMPGRSLTCGTTLQNQSNGQAGSTDVIDTYDVCKILNPLDESGPETTYLFDATSNGTATVTLFNIATGTPHIFVIEDRGRGCNPDDCVGFSTGGTLQFGIVAGASYYVVIEGFQGSVATYDITLACP